ncbi:MAG: glycosyltransferase family 4 protein [Bacteroidales bacterium]|nr:glycosyltransferase family 4 protein [Bacteroidales bacterium]
MRVLFDHQAFCNQMHGGVSRCFVELYQHLPSEVKAQIALKECNNSYIREYGICPEESDAYNHWLIEGNWHAKGRLFNIYNWLRGEKSYWNKKKYNKFESIRLLKNGCFDIFHPTFFDDYFLPYLNGKPFVLTIHDMMPELYPQYFDQETDEQILGKRKLAPLASAIIAVSENTKEDIIRILRVPEEKVHVIYHGCSFEKAANPQPLFDEPYILYVGDRKCYKNFNLFVRDIASVLKHHQELKVVCTGVELTNEEVAQMRHLNIQDRFIHRWIKTDEEFYSLYHYAQCFVYTSEYEGFGIPILEAYQADCPVLLNRASCFPEIAGDAAVFFLMKESESNFSQVLESFLSLSWGDLSALKRKQRNRLEKYSWNKSAEKLAAVYASVL